MWKWIFSKNICQGLVIFKDIMAYLKKLLILIKISNFRVNIHFSVVSIIILPYIFQKVFFSWFLKKVNKLQKVFHRITPWVGQFCDKESWLENLIRNEGKFYFLKFFCFICDYEYTAANIEIKSFKDIYLFQKNIKFLEKNHGIAPSYPNQFCPYLSWFYGELKV